MGHYFLDTQYNLLNVQRRSKYDIHHADVPGCNATLLEGLHVSAPAARPPRSQPQLFRKVSATVLFTM